MKLFSYTVVLVAFLLVKSCSATPFFAAIRSAASSNRQTSSGRSDQSGRTAESPASQTNQGNDASAEITGQSGQLLRGPPNLSREGMNMNQQFYKNADKNLKVVVHPDGSADMGVRILHN
jgi:hypothetical protein